MWHGAVNKRISVTGVESTVRSGVACTVLTDSVRMAMFCNRIVYKYFWDIRNVKNRRTKNGSVSAM